MFWRLTLVFSVLTFSLSLATITFVALRLTSYEDTAIFVGTGMFSYAKHLDPNSRFYDAVSGADPRVQLRQTERKLYAWGDILVEAGDRVESDRRMLFAVVAVMLLSFICSATSVRKLTLKQHPVDGSGRTTVQTA